MSNNKHYFAVVLTVLLGLFIFQNIAFVEVNILFWSISAPRSLVLLSVFLVGAVAGFLFSSRSKKGSL